MKKLFYMLMILMMLIIFQGCESIPMTAKEVQIEPDSEAPEEIGDYVSVEDNTPPEIRLKDISFK